ncbi:HNH endonuclease signature motif containing protein [Aeromicrobium alkaliterrae]|uniref:HNH endonuclease signature motif containing protein n=1 Tax=Aeromicrobium alkaliterrae TaxID=302168 RepID=A0ABN2JFH2_9ACTN
MSNGVATVADLMGLARDRAMAEAAEWQAMLAFHDAELARIEAMEVSSMRKLVERSGIAVELGQALSMSPGRVSLRLGSADRLRDEAPLTWWAFGRGRIDAARAREISSTLEKLERPESRELLDGSVVAYASKHTVVELRRWLKRFVNRVEADLAIERADAEREKRHVELVQVDDGMAWLNAYLPAHQAAAIASRLRRGAIAARTAEADHAAAEGTEQAPRRTRSQIEADLLAAWLMSADDSQTARGKGMAIDIAVLVDAPVLTSLTQGHAAAADGSWEVPSDWVLDSALTGDAFWHRLLVDPITRDTLAHDYPGYSPPAVLKRAIVLRDGVCSGPGCLRPAETCDLDHREPWPEGPTSGENLDPKCRRDHALKGHGVLAEILARHHRARASDQAEADRGLPRHQSSVFENRLARWLTAYDEDAA